jgi:hypothetical protein
MRFVSESRVRYFSSTSELWSYKILKDLREGTIITCYLYQTQPTTADFEEIVCRDSCRDCNYLVTNDERRRILKILLKNKNKIR